MRRYKVYVQIHNLENYIKKTIIAVQPIQQNRIK